MTAQRRLAVLGSPIAHSKSPALHAAAYRVLGLDWDYGIADVPSGELARFVANLDGSWRGLSLTMPLKKEILPLLDRRHDLVELTGAANTVLFDNGVRGFNTDVFGVTESFRGAGIESVGSAWVLGAGATAASVIVALSELGARSLVVLVRDPLRAESIVRLGTEVGVAVEVLELTMVEDAAQVLARHDVPDVVISTLPGGAAMPLRFPGAVSSTSVLLDVAYDPWPSPLAQTWTGPVISGLEMLLFQALGQVRIFVGGSPHGELHSELRSEGAVLAAMRESLTS
jgi:shikimate dehydrogenase